MNFFYYVLETPSGKLVGIDQNSDGYPTETEQLNDVKFWNYEDDARAYAEMFESREFRLREFRGHTE
jgi:hypothetical protein